MENQTEQPLLTTASTILQPSPLQFNDNEETKTATINTTTTTTTTTTNTKLPLLHKLAVGGVAGIIGATSTFPIDIIKTRLQSQTETSIPKLCRTILARDGVRGFYHGLPPTLLGILPEKAIKLAFNDYFREMFELPDGRVTMPMQLLASSLAGSMQVIATNPYEIVKIRLQTQNHLPKNARKSMTDIIKDLGIRGLYKGTTSTLCRDVPYAMIFFPSYASLKMYITERVTNGEETVPGIVCAGAMAGAIAAALVTPMDVVKTRWQVKGSVHKSGISCLKNVIANDGPQALFKGVVPRMFVQAPLFAITLLAFELQKKYMANRS